MEVPEINIQRPSIAFIFRATKHLTLTCQVNSSTLYNISSINIIVAMYFMLFFCRICRRLFFSEGNVLSNVISPGYYKEKPL